MRPLYTLLLLIFHLVSYGQKQTYNFDLAVKIDSLYSLDQKWRLMHLHYDEGHLSDTILYNFIESNWIKSDSLNLLEAKRIVTTFGFPGYDLVGASTSNNFWSLIQHADNDVVFQESCLKQMKILVDEKKANGKNYAFLIDRVKVNQNQKQIYGTQLYLNKEQTSYEIPGVDKPERLNERRKLVGLETIEEYIKTMNSVYAGRLKNQN